MSIREDESVPAGHQTLGDFLRSLRIKAKLKLREVEERSGVSNAYLSQLETGKINKPSPHIIHKLASAYDVSYERLMIMAGYIVGPDSPISGEQPVVPGSRIPTSAIRELSPEEEDAVLNYLEYLRLRKAGACGKFPTPTAEIISAAGLRVEHSFFTDQEILNIISDVPAKLIKTARNSLHGLVDIRGRTIYVRQDIPLGEELPHLTIHETAHAYLDWQKNIYLFVQENELTISRDVIDVFERQANQFAWEIIFQLDQFRIDAENAEFSLRTPEQLAHRYGTTPYAAIRRFVETNRRPCAVLIWSRSGKSGELALPPCNCVQSDSFSQCFGKTAWRTSLNRFSRSELIFHGEFGHRMQCELPALNRVSIQCETNSLQMGRHLFVLVFPENEVTSVLIR